MTETTLPVRANFSGYLGAEMVTSASVESPFRVERGEYRVEMGEYRVEMVNGEW
jgi:hypothetical protein